MAVGQIGKRRAFALYHVEEVLKSGQETATTQSQLFSEQIVKEVKQKIAPAIHHHAQVSSFSNEKVIKKIKLHFFVSF
jgi:hypothetical protein